MRGPALAAVLLVLLSSPALWAAAAAEKPGWEPQDQTLQEVLRLRAAGVGERVILTWLSQARPPVRPLAPDDLIGLTRQGVPDSLIEALVALAAGKEPSGGFAEESAGGKVPVRFDLDYRPIAREGEEFYDLFYYLNGELLAWSPGAQNPLNRKSLVFVKALPPGRYLVRLNRERHTALSGGRFRHESSVCPAAVPLTVNRGPEIEVKVEFSESTFFWKPPLSFTVTRAGEILAAERGLAGDPDSWRPLCEDLEINLESGAPRRAARRQLQDCVRWAALWEGLEKVPDRKAVLGEMARYEFRPVPVTSR